MTRYLKHAIAVLMLVASSSLLAEKPEAVPVIGKINWVYDYDEGKRLSRESGKPMFVVFRCER